jgi:hypothetical protein
MIDWINALRDDDEILGLTIHKEWLWKTINQKKIKNIK